MPEKSQMRTFVNLTWHLRRERMLIYQASTPTYGLCIQGNITIAQTTAPRRLDVLYRVLNTYELLEHVLFFLPPQDQLQARQVCGGFLKAIDRSSKIRSSMGLCNVTALELKKAPISIRGITSTISDARLGPKPESIRSHHGIKYDRRMVH